MQHILHSHNDAKVVMLQENCNAIAAQTRPYSGQQLNVEQPGQQDKCSVETH